MDLSFLLGLVLGAGITFGMVSVALRVSRRHYEAQLTLHQKAAIEAAAQRDATVEQLRRSNGDLEQFAYVASHDLKEPLRTIEAYTELLFSDFAAALQDPQAKTYQRFIVEASQRAAALISDLLRFSHAGAGLSPAPFDLADALQDAIVELNGRAAGSRLEIASLPRVQADRGMVVRVLSNLLSNALKFVRPGERPHVTVEAVPAARAGFVEVRVIDRGVGLDHAHKETIFEPFRRLYSQAEYPGTGIGLALARRIVHAHGGEIWADGVPGKGTTISFTLPIATDDLAAATDLVG